MEQWRGEPWRGHSILVSTSTHSKDCRHDPVPCIALMAHVASDGVIGILVYNTALPSSVIVQLLLSIVYIVKAGSFAFVLQMLHSLVYVCYRFRHSGSFMIGWIKYR